MKAYILYGSKRSQPEAKSMLEHLLALQFEARHSDYQGGEYFRAGSKDGEGFVLKQNVDPYDGEPVEACGSEFPTLFYVNATFRATALKAVMDLAGNAFVLLREEVVS